MCYNTSMKKIRDAILEEMSKSNLTIYQVSNIVRYKIPQRTVYAFLTGEKDTGTETASIIMEELGLEIKKQNIKCTSNKGEQFMHIKSYGVDIFINDDKAYLQWLIKNPNGFIINSFLHPSKDYLILHRSSCWSIRTTKRTNWTTTGFIKVCSGDKENLSNWADKEVGGELQPCKICKP